MQGIKLYPNSKIYILAPQGIRTGGPTLLHQLASMISKIVTHGTVEAQMRYYTLEYKNAPDNAYSEYHIKETYNINDNPKNVMIVPESATHFLYEVNDIQKVIWWMSVDNYLESLQSVYISFKRRGNYTFSPMPGQFNFTGNKEFFHFVQSRYALDFLRINGVSEEKIFFVGDYLHPVFLKNMRNVNIEKKEKIVAFNPRKGEEFTKKIKDYASHIKFVPIQNMTPKEVENLLSRAMVYIDFGNHPGKDRIPREAAISGCVVITGQRGAAANEEDIPINSEFKFNDIEANIPSIVKKIEKVFNDFPRYHAKFEKYRQIILAEPKKFEDDVINAFNLSEYKRNYSNVALFQSGARGRFLKELTDTDDSLKAIFRLGDEGDKDLKDIEKISFEDAVFLYQEGRIDSFMAVSISEKEKEEISAKLSLAGVSNDDIMLVEIKQ